MKRILENYIAVVLFSILVFGAFSFTQKVSANSDPENGKDCYGIYDYFCCEYGTGHCVVITNEK